jgi:hypothetical protein
MAAGERSFEGSVYNGAVTVGEVDEGAADPMSGQRVAS